MCLFSCGGPFPTSSNNPDDLRPMTDQEIIEKNKRDWTWAKNSTPPDADYLMAQAMRQANSRDGWLSQEDIDLLGENDDYRPGMFETWGSAVKTIGVGLVLAFLIFAGCYIIAQGIKLAWLWGR